MVDTIELKRTDKYLKQKFIKWASIELKLAVDDINEKECADPNEIRWQQEAQQELERRSRER